ncbi:lipopolysaccharide assembly protein LapA domain-containing protein [Rhodococcus sp. NPDC003322]
MSPTHDTPDPHESTPPVPPPEPEPESARADVPAATAPASDTAPALGGTRAAATWTGLVIGALVLILLLVFILQNLDSVTWNLFWWEFSLPLGVSLLLAAIAGALIMALAGGVRILQIRRLAKRATTAD